MNSKSINIDWQQLALNLRSKAPLSALAKQNGWNPEYLNKLAREEMLEPKFSRGLELLNLHLDLCGIDKHKKLVATNA